MLSVVDELVNEEVIANQNILTSKDISWLVLNSEGIRGNRSCESCNSDMGCHSNASFVLPRKVVPQPSEKRYESAKIYQQQ
jgi:hypothetical protein